jgi:hypothetical protein
MAIASSTALIKDVLLKKGNPKKFILVGDSIWDKPTYVIHSEIKKNLNQLGIDNAYFSTQATMSSIEWVNGKYATKSMSKVLTECLGDGGEDTFIMWTLGVNDIGLSATTVYDYNTHFAPAELKIMGAIEFLKTHKPNVKLFFVSAPASGYINFNDNYEKMYKNIAAYFDAPFVSGYDALKGVRPATQHTNSASSAYNDSIHPSEFGLLRFWNYIMMNIIPGFYLKNVTPFQYTTPAPAPNDQPNFIPINNGWRNDFAVVSGVLELKPTNTASHWCFPKLFVLPGQLFTLKLPTGLMGSFVPEVKWVTNEGTMIGGEPTKLPPLESGQDRWLISAPFGVNRLHVNISDDVNFPAALAADPTICHLKQAYSRAQYQAPIEDIMVGLPYLFAPKKNTTSGSALISGVDTVFSYNVSHNLGTVPTFIDLQSRSADSCGDYFVSAITATTFTITFINQPPVGTDNIIFDWVAIKS